ncbi:Dachshund like protein 1 [Myotis brandtii]|uniref:Dachshund like protein 1 n=1 Tax=Myotis brandtii TaxID=109478 RepID=S7NSU9_MYOBR|nr:Dachshund like protein 1 [Myotis brandtii]
MPHSVPGLMSPGIIPPTGLTAAAAAAAAATNAAIAEAMKVKKIKLEAMSNYHASNNQHGADSENGDMNSSVASLKAPNSQWIGSEVPPAHRYGSSQSHAVPAVIPAILL